MLIAFRNEAKFKYLSTKVIFIVYVPGKFRKMLE